MKFRLTPAVPACLALFFLAIASGPSRAATPNKPPPFIPPIGGMRLDSAVRGEVSGLALSVNDAGWPTFTMLGDPYSTIGGLGKVSDHPNEAWSIQPMSFGTARLAGAGHLADQQLNDVTNTMTFGNDRNESLKVTMTRLSPAVLLDASASELELFGAADGAPRLPKPGNTPMKWDPDHQVMVPIPPAERGPFEPGRFPPPVQYIKPMRWATCHADGTVVTGVLGKQAPLMFPFIDWHKRFTQGASAAPQDISAPPLDGLGQHWLLLWYGSDSPLLSSKIPLVFTNFKTFHVLAPWRLATAFQADVPMLLVFEHAPKAIELRQDGEVKHLVVSFAGPAGKVVLLPIFGHDVQAAATTEQWLAAFPPDLKARCDDWAKRLGDFPVNETEQTTYDPQADRVTCTETFQYLTVRPGGEKTALVRPMLALGLQQKLPAGISPAPVDLKYATQFGPLLAVAGDHYEWHVDGLGKYVDGTESIGPDNAKSILLEKELSAEVGKVLAAGHLAPWIVSRQAPWCVNYGSTYGKDPSEVLYYLSEALPLLPADQQAKVRDYLIREAETYPPDKVERLKTTDGAQREYFNIPLHFLQDYDGPIGTGAVTDEYFEKTPSLYRAYGVARYYLSTKRKPTKEVVDFWRSAMQQSLADRDWATLGWYWGKYATYRPDGSLNYRYCYWQYTPRAVHRDAAGLIGYLRLCQLSNTPAEPEAWGQLARLMAFRFALARYGPYLLESGMFHMPGTPDAAPYTNMAMLASSRDRMSPSPDPGKVLAKSGDFSKPENHFEQVWEVNQHEVTMFSGAEITADGTLYDGFMAAPGDGDGNSQIVFSDLTPEVGRILADWGLKEDVARYVKHYAAVQPIWYKAYSDSEHLSEGELGLVLPTDSYQYFVAHAWIAGTPPGELERYIDEPWVAVGDFFYMDKLAETIKAYRGVTWAEEH